MNPGVLSVILYAITMTLLLTGWWDQLLLRLNIRRMTLIGWFTIAIIASRLTFFITEEINVNLGFVFVLSAAVYCWGKTTTGYGAMLFGATVFTGSVCYFIREISVVDPALLLLPSGWLQAGVLFLLAGVSVRSLWERMALMTGGITAGYLLSLWHHLGELPVWTFGEPAFFDLVWSCLLGLLIMESIPHVAMWGRWRSQKKLGETNG